MFAPPACPTHSGGQLEAPQPAASKAERLPSAEVTYTTPPDTAGVEPAPPATVPVHRTVPSLASSATRSPSVTNTMPDATVGAVTVSRLVVHHQTSLPVLASSATTPEYIVANTSPNRTAGCG